MIVNIYIPNWYSHSYTFQACYQFLCQIIVYLHSQYLQWAIIQHGTNQQELSVPAWTGCHQKNIQIQLIICLRLQRCNRRVQRQYGTAVNHAPPRMGMTYCSPVSSLNSSIASLQTETNEQLYLDVLSMASSSSKNTAFTPVCTMLDDSPLEILWI